MTAPLMTVIFRAIRGKPRRKVGWSGRRACRGAATELRATIGTLLPVPERVAGERAVARARTVLSEEAWAAALAAGRALPLAAVIADVLGEPARRAGRAPALPDRQVTAGS